MYATLEERMGWQNAINDEFDSLDNKPTWELSEQPEANTLHTHVVLKVKRNADGTFERFSACNVAGGNFQTFATRFYGDLRTCCFFYYSEGISVHYIVV